MPPNGNLAKETRPGPPHGPEAAPHPDDPEGPLYAAKGGDHPGCKLLLSYLSGHPHPAEKDRQKRMNRDRWP